MNNLFNLDGKVALITGSSGGIGKAIAETMGEHGASVIITSNDLEGCNHVCKELIKKNIKAISLPCDITLKASLAELVKAAIKHFGRVDVRK